NDINLGNFHTKLLDLLKDEEFFYKNLSTLSVRVNTIINEEQIGDSMDPLGDRKREEEIFSIKMRERLDCVLPFLKEAYNGGNFNDRIKVLSLLEDIVSRAIFFNNMNLRRKLMNMSAEFLESEKKENGNYYITSHLSALFVTGDSITEEQIAPNKYVLPDDNEYFITDKKIKVPGFGFPENQKPYTQNDNLRSILKDNTFPVSFFFLNEVRKQFQENAGFALNTTSLEEQYSYFNYTKEITNKESEFFFSFLKKYGKDGFRTFLSIEHGGKEMGDKILTLGEKLPEESTQVLFKTYGEMVDASDSVGDLLQQNLAEKATPELVNQAKESLLVGGKQLLEKYADKAQVCEGLDCETLGKELQERLALAKASVFAFSYACKTLVERGEFSFEDFKKAKLSYDKSPIPEKMREEIIAMHKENTKQYPEGLRDYWRGTLREGLEKENPKQMVVSVEYEGNVTTAMRVIEQEDGSWYGASFNVNPTVMGSRIGSELLKKVIEDLAKDKPFVADCYADNPMLETYTKKFGFEITNTYENYKDTGAKVYQITLSPSMK
ncbi:MAG: hypothetical protein QG551_167, partial [Patescibacteria group bacterium]|nr:hypothetical protein [Patescibacteria group bacterium]